MNSETINGVKTKVYASRTPWWGRLTHFIGDLCMIGLLWSYLSPRNVSMKMRHRFHLIKL